MVVSVVVVQFPYFLDAFFSLYLSRTLSSWAVAGKTRECDDRARVKVTDCGNNKA